MNKTTIVDLIAYTTQLNPAQRFDEYTPVAWHDVLKDVPATFEQGREAIAIVARTEPWIYPSAIYRELQAILRTANPQPPAAAIEAPSKFEPNPDRDERIARGMAQVRKALAEATPFRYSQDTTEVPESLRRAREAAVEHRAGQSYRDKNLRLGRAGADVLRQINQNRKATT